MIPGLFNNLLRSVGSSSSSMLWRNQMLPQTARSMQPLFNLQQNAHINWLSNSRKKRLPLTTKRAGKGFYKGNRSRKEGWIDSKGRFHSVKEWHTELVVPDLKNFTLKPYVGPDVKRHVF